MECKQTESNSFCCCLFFIFFILDLTGAFQGVIFMGGGIGVREGRGGANYPGM